MLYRYNILSTNIINIYAIILLIQYYFIVNDDVPTVESFNKFKAASAAFLRLRYLVLLHMFNFLLLEFEC